VESIIFHEHASNLFTHMNVDIVSNFRL
jgi:hypothetical protein